MKSPLNFDNFLGKPILWMRFKALPQEEGLIIQLDKDSLTAFDIEYPYDELVEVAEWSENRTTWNEFYVVSV